MSYYTNYSRRRLYWPSQQTLDDVLPTAQNSAGSYDLATKGTLVCGHAIRGGTLIWTTVDLWLMTYIGTPYIYRLDKAGDDCGIIGMKAFVTIDTKAFWMGYNGFFMYDGFALPIACEVQDYVFGSLNRTYANTIWALSNAAYGEVTWFYPSASATSPDRYVTYNYREQHWAFGTLSRACGVGFIPPGVVPVLIDASGNVYDHETGTGRNSEGTPSIESGPIEVAEGDNLVALQHVVPDDKTVGDVNLTIYGAMYPDETETTYGPYTLTKFTSVRVKARQIRVKLTEAVANAWRVGVIRLSGLLSSKR